MADSQKPNKKRKMNPFAIPAEPRQFCLSLPKLNYSFPAFIVAPMVKQSDLAFRTLCRRQGATVTYTPMLYSTTFASDANYRQMNLEVSAEDRPLAVQFCANEPWTLLKAALAALEFKHIDAIDLNLGCPQSHAQRGHYGSYLLGRKDWPLVYEMLYLLSHTIAIPVTCKIRLLSSLNETIEFCRLLERAGVALIAVHGRTQKSTSRRRAGKADLQAIREICRQSRIPIIANGNICCPADVIRSIRETGAQGVMSAEAILRNPALFSSLNDQNVSTLFHSAPEEFHFDVFKSTMIQMKQKKTSNYAMQLVVAEFEMEADGEWGSNEEKRSNGIDSCLSQQQYSISGRKRKPHTHDISCSFSCSSLTVNDSIFQAREYLKICRLETTCPPPQWIAMHIKYMFEPYIDCILDVKKSLNLLHTPFKFRGVLSVAIAKTHQTLQEKSNFAQSQTHKKLNFRKIDFCKQGESPSARQNTLNVVDKSHSDEVMQNKSECTLVVEKIQNGETNLNDKVAIDAGACVIDSKAFICEDTLSINTDNIEVGCKN